MKKIILLSFSIFIFFSCKNNNTPASDNQKAEIENITEADDVELEEKITVNLSDYDGFTVGNGVRMRESKNVKSTKLAELENGTLVKILDVSLRAVIGKHDEYSCDSYGYPWIKVALPTGQEGWIFGKYIYKMIEKGTSSTNAYIGSTYQFDDITYEFGIAKDYSYPTSDDDGLTGCDDNYLPFFHKKDNQQIHPIFLKRNQETRENLEIHPNGYWHLVESEGRHDSIKRILPILYGIRVSLEVGFQDGYQTGKIDVVLKDNKFQADVINIKNEVN